MKKAVMILLILAGLTGMGAIQAMGDIPAEQAKSPVYSANFGPTGMAFPGIARSHPSDEVIKKTLKGYRSIIRSPFLVELMQLA